MKATLNPTIASTLAKWVAPLIDGKLVTPAATVLVDFPMTLTIDIDRSTGELVITPTNVHLSQNGPDPEIKWIRINRQGGVRAKGGVWMIEAERTLVSPASRLTPMGFMSSAEPDVLDLVPPSVSVGTAAAAAGHDPAVVLKTMEALTEAFPPSSGGRRRARRMRREALAVAMDANGVPGWVKALVWFGKLGALFLGPYAPIVQAIIWAVDAWLGGVG